MNESFPHIPVLHHAVMDQLHPSTGETVLDVTAGLGGHSASFLKAIGERGQLIVFDADEKNLSVARKRLSAMSGNAEYRHLNFGEIASVDLPLCDIIFADLGLSSPQLDDPERGFSFRSEGPLDLRFDQSHGKTACEIIEVSDEKDLAELFRTYGELFKEARRLGSLLAGQSYPTTTILRSKIESAFGFRAKQILPQVFQALRIAVNDELYALGQLLGVGPTLLKQGGRMGIISFHSLEDRMVKHAFRAISTPQKDPVTGKISVAAPFEVQTPKAIVPSESEIAENPRSRSAKFRVLRRIV